MVQSQCLGVESNTRTTMYVYHRYMLPAVPHCLARKEPLKIGEGPVGLVVVPTRELAAQVESVCAKMYKLFSLRCVSFYGGVPKEQQLDRLLAPTHFVVATPGRLIDIVRSGDMNLRAVTYFVLDEADRYDSPIAIPVEAPLSSYMRVHEVGVRVTSGLLSGLVEGERSGRDQAAPARSSIFVTPKYAFGCLGGQGRLWSHPMPVAVCATLDYSRLGFESKWMPSLARCDQMHRGYYFQQQLQPQCKRWSRPGSPIPPSSKSDPLALLPQLFPPHRVQRLQRKAVPIQQPRATITAMGEQQHWIQQRIQPPKMLLMQLPTPQPTPQDHLRPRVCARLSKSRHRTKSPES